LLGAAFRDRATRIGRGIFTCTQFAGARADGGVLIIEGSRNTRCMPFGRVVDVRGIGKITSGFFATLANSFRWCRATMTRIRTTFRPPAVGALLVVWYFTINYRLVLARPSRTITLGRTILFDARWTLTTAPFFTRVGLWCAIR
jgi:hypothetical protein